MQTARNPRNLIEIKGLERTTFIASPLTPHPFLLTLSNSSPKYVPDLSKKPTTYSQLPKSF